MDWALLNASCASWDGNMGWDGMGWDGIYFYYNQHFNIDTKHQCGKKSEIIKKFKFHEKKKLTTTTTTTTTITITTTIIIIIIIIIIIVI